jgi:fatty acid desaturase 2 (delta-6 desaturase)
MTLSPKAKKSLGDDSAAIVPRKANEVLIAGYLYDVTGFKHPGGSIIKFFSETGDATDAFEQFHLQSTRARNMLASLPRRVAPPEELATAEAVHQARRHEAMTKDMLALTRKLRAEGWFECSPAHTAYRVVELLALLGAGLWLLTAGWSITGLLVLGLFQGRCGWLMHEAGHWSLTTNIGMDTLLQEVIYGFGPGMSGGWWRSQHNRHHATPQKLTFDVDLETLPLVAFNAKVYERAKKSPLLRAWLSAQGFLFAPVTCLLVALSWQFILHPRFIVRMRKYREGAVLLVRYAAIYWFSTYVLRASLLQLALGYLVSLVAGSTYIFVNFALSHTHLPTTDATENVHWLDYASKHTVNIAPSWLCDWWMGYLNYQIEHHLFPSMPQFRHGRVAPQVRELFAKHGLVYDVRGYFPALVTTFSNLHTVGNP